MIHCLAGLEIGVPNVTQLIDLDDLLTTALAAAMLGVKPDTMHQWRWNGKGPKYLKLGDGKRAAIRYQRSELVRWLAERQYANTSQYSVDAKGQKILPPWAPGSTPPTSPASPPDKGA
jgi:hypothetical protein